MLHLGRPDDATLDRILAEQSQASLTYDTPGMTQSGEVPEGFQHDVHTMGLGVGDDAFARGAEGLRRWEAHRAAGLVLAPSMPPLAVGTTVVQAIRTPGAFTLAACRIVAVVDEPAAFGFAYGTLPEHPESGEESFVVHRRGDGVDFVVTAVARPRHPLARIGSPVTRLVQLLVTRRYLTGLDDFARRR